MTYLLRISLLLLALWFSGSVEVSFADWTSGLNRDQWQLNIPDKARRYHDEGKAFLLQGQIDEAIQSFGNSIKVKSDYYVAQYNMAVAYALKAANQDEVSTELAWQYTQAAQVTAQKYEINDPALLYLKSYLSYVQLALLPDDVDEIKRTKLEKDTETYALESLGIDPVYSKSLQILGALKEYSGDEEGAKSYYSKAAFLGDETAVASLNNLGDSQYTVKLKAKVVKFQGAITKDDEVDFYILNWGGDPKVVPAVEKASSRDPKSKELVDTANIKWNKSIGKRGVRLPITDEAVKNELLNISKDDAETFVIFIPGKSKGEPYDGLITSAYPARNLQRPIP